MNKYETVRIRRVFGDDHHYIEIGRGEFPGSVRLDTGGDLSNEEYFGRIRLDLPSGWMREIGMALIEAADDADRSEVAK